MFYSTTGGLLDLYYLIYRKSFILSMTEGNQINIQMLKSIDNTPASSILLPASAINISLDLIGDISSDIICL